MATATNKFNLQVAKQTAKGAAATAPAYFLELLEGGLKSPPTVDTLNSMDGGIWTPSHKRIGYVDAGGAPVMLVSPKMAPLIFYAGLGGLATTGAADPWTHTITPATSLTSFPYLSGWELFDDQWTFFRDLQVSGFILEVAVASKFMRLTPTFVGMAKEKKVAAPTPATQEDDVGHWLDAEGYWVMNGDLTNIFYGGIPTDLTTAYTWCTAYKAAYNAHCAVSSGVHHKAADAVNVIAASTPTDLPTLISFLGEVKTDYNAHVVSTTVHYFADVRTLSYGTLTTLADCLAAIEEVQGYKNAPGDYNGHLGATAALRNLRFEVNMGATPLQGESMVPYTVKRKRGAINCAVEMLLEDFRMMNLVKFGDPAPAVGTETTSEIQHGSLNVKFTLQTTGNERSVQIIVPQFDFDPAGVMDTVGNPEGDEIYLTLGGEASGTAPIASVIVKNSVSTY